MTGRRAVIDGATGFVGANLAASLIADGFQVTTLSRQDAAATRHKVVEASILTGVAPADRSIDVSGIEVFPYALGQANLGLDNAQLDRVFGEPCDYWHVAANVNFRPGTREEVLGVNVGGTSASLAAFERWAPLGSRYLFLSTAYCCGVEVDQPIERWYDPAPPSAFRNFYEYSKRQAELLVRDAIERGTDAAVLRLGQVVGDSRTGHSATDYGMYNLIRALWAVARRRPNEHVRIEGHRDANVHPVPIDATIRWMRAIAAAELASMDAPIFHVIDREPVAVSEVTDALSRWLPLDISMVDRTGFETRPSTQLERVLAARLAYTGTYLAQPFQFGRANLDGLTPGEAQVTTPDALDRIIRAFVQELTSSRPVGSGVDRL
jgi:nucleoside-diphosphate-sugar epimerase